MLYHHCPLGQIKSFLTETFHTTGCREGPYWIPESKSIDQHRCLSKNVKVLKKDVPSSFKKDTFMYVMKNIIARRMKVLQYIVGTLAVTTFHQRPPVCSDQIPGLGGHKNYM